jgi:glucose/arabinose dehydrogenase
MKHTLPWVLILLLTACANAGTPSITTAAPGTTLVASPDVGADTASPQTPVGIAPTINSSNPGSFPNPAAYHWIPLITGMAMPTDIQFPDDGTGRMFVIEQGGRIRIVENGQMLDPPFLDITNRVGSQGNEQGLLGLAFHPDFQHNPFFYVNYTDLNGNTVIARFQVKGNLADPATEKDLMQIQQPFPNHNGGGMVFGPDGYLYIGLGDGGSQGDPNGNGQNTNTRLGKLLRIDVDHGDPYALPSSNPFVKGGGRPEIWAYGLRNPWRFSFDKGSANLYIADVGQDTWEEVDVVSPASAGLNFGWNYYEGMHPYAGQAPAGVNFIMSVAEYSHAVGGCAIIGGYVYRGTMPEWQGIYFYGDECSGFIWGLSHSPNGWQSQLLFRTGETITSFGQDPSGEIYFAGRGGSIYRLGR